MAFNVFLREVVRNPGSSLTEINPWENICTVKSYFPESTEKVPKHELIKGIRYFK
jgi:hypothetical protein